MRHFEFYIAARELIVDINYYINIVDSSTSFYENSHKNLTYKVKSILSTSFLRRKILQSRVDFGRVNYLDWRRRRLASYTIPYNWY